MKWSKYEINAFLNPFDPRNVIKKGRARHHSIELVEMYIVMPSRYRYLLSFDIEKSEKRIPGFFQRVKTH
jgi:hypothetical protein